MVTTHRNGSSVGCLLSLWLGWVKVWGDLRFERRALVRIQRVPEAKHVFLTVGLEPLTELVDVRRLCVCIRHLYKANADH